MIQTTGTTAKSRFDIQPATFNDAYDIACKLRVEDYRECVEGHGVNPKVEIPMSLLRSECYTFRSPNGYLGGIAGVYNDNEIWMLCTPEIYQYPIAFAKDARRFIEGRSEPYLWCRADARNESHLRLLKFLGFKEKRRLIHGPNKLLFIELAYGTITGNRT